jgi:hypothetical protein
MSNACETQILIEQHTSKAVGGSGKPSYAFGISGSNPAGTWYDSHGRPSNKVGIPFGLDNGELIEIWCGNELLVEYDFSLYYHLGDETGLTLLTTVTVPAAARTKLFTVADLGLVTVPKTVQIAARVETVPGTNPRNCGAYAVIKGTF